MSPNGFGSVNFPDIVPDPEGDVPIINLGMLDDGTEHIVAGLLAGSKYTPGTHDQPVTVHILAGSGTFLFNGCYECYQAGRVFKVPAGMRHGFTQVTRATLFVKVAEGPIPDFAEPLAEVAVAAAAS